MKLIVDGFEPQAAIIEAPQIVQQVDVQFQTSLKEAVYAYVFGDKMGQLSLSGIAFANRCNDDSANGLKDLFDYYKEYRASKRTDVITTTFGPEALSGFLIGLRMSPREISNVTMNFELAISVLPKKGGNGS
ncbi:MAG TPA: hypothetical protein VLT59_04310 [Steroidobacteraceae bacterium]|nr:hypothetical protein [Steroidobacteraceae bacterium]